MKHLLLLTLIIVGVGCKAQWPSSDDVFKTKKDSVWQWVPDTVKVIMLVSDTTVTTTIIYEGVVLSETPKTYAMYGYAVYAGPSLYYLDDRKRPLVNKIIWIHRKID